ncbi:hypothetical protein HY487_00120 [Candidatus Woesearchaeota archaeon]|nr:hypothetical protein [Candidatus Woesearchaeota archaeon]
MPYKILAAAATGASLAALLIGGAGCAARPNVVQPLTVVHPTMARVEQLEGTVERKYGELKGQYDELKRQSDAYRAETERELGMLRSGHTTLKEGQDSLKGRVEAVEATQTRILERPLNESSGVISKKTHAAVYADLFKLFLAGSSQNLGQAAGLHGTHIYLEPLVGRDYNVFVVSGVTETSDVKLIERYHRATPENEGVKVPAAKIKEIVPEGVLQQFLDWKIIKPVKIRGKDYLNAPTPPRKPAKKPFTRTQNEKWTRPNGNNSRRSDYARR